MNKYFNRMKKYLLENDLKLDNFSTVTESKESIKLLYKLPILINDNVADNLLPLLFKLVVFIVQQDINNDALKFQPLFDMIIQDILKMFKRQPKSIWTSLNNISSYWLSDNDCISFTHALTFCNTQVKIQFLNDIFIINKRITLENMNDFIKSLVAACVLYNDDILLDFIFKNYHLLEEEYLLKYYTQSSKNCKCVFHLYYNLNNVSFLIDKYGIERVHIR